MTLIKIIYRSIELCVAYGNYEFENRLRNLIISKPIVYSLRSISTFQPATLIANLLDPLSKDSKPALLKWLRILIDHLLDDHDSSGMTSTPFGPLDVRSLTSVVDLTDPDADVQVSRLLQLANDFSIQLCQLKMRIIFDAEKTNPLFENGSTLTQTFFRGIASAFKEKGSIWSDLVSVLDDNCARQVRVHAEQIFLQSMTFPMPLEPNDRGENNESLARALMAVIEATSTSINTRVGPVISSALVEKLNMLISYIMPTSNENAENDRMMDPPPSPRDLFWESRCWLILFLRIIILHKSAFSNSKVGMSDQARMVVGLCALLQVCFTFSSFHRGLFFPPPSSASKHWANQLSYNLTERIPPS